MAAPKGNTYASKDQRLWTDMLRRKLTQDPNKLEKIALAVIDAAMDAQPWAVAELANRLDGKAVQQIESNVSLTNVMAKELSTVALEAIARGVPPEEAAQLH